MSKIKAYLSHPIAGKLGNKATDHNMAINCSKAICVGAVLEICVPNLDLYVPAKHQEFVLNAYRRKYIDVEKVLNVDCDILGNKELLIVYNWQKYLSNGVATEINYAKKHNIPMYSFTELNERVLDELRDIVGGLQNARV